MSANARNVRLFSAHRQLMALLIKLHLDRGRVFNVQKQGHLIRKTEKRYTQHTGIFQADKTRRVRKLRSRLG